ncbi:MAG: tRNA lysidine(34) synthetase TilS [Lachnospiraceae bacterium]|nr:tRNA lysidine(34) synthetase TilS [Lachnospiraceae bacterium]MEE1342303.1 tRNA lysidine(34) synthetase TilS [Lachnospiraceae bacterium]
MVREKVKKWITANELIKKEDKIVVGVSGGADSICLLHLLDSLKEELRLTLYVVHINHGIRESGNEDEAFVKAFCKERSIECSVFKTDIKQLAKITKTSVEEAGRQYRYECFEQVRREKGADSIAVAHNENDQAETMLFRLARGSGIGGIAGMKPKNGYVIRPILSCSREEIEEYLKKVNQSFCTDETNFDTIYTRNQIRHNVLPLLCNINSNAISHMFEAAKDLREYESFFMEQFKIWWEKNVAVEEERILLPVKEMHLGQKLIREQAVREAIEQLAGQRKNIGRVHIEAVLHLLDKQVGRQIDLPYELEALKQYEHIVIQKKKEEVEEEIDILLTPNETYQVPFMGGTLRIAIQNYKDYINNEKKGYTKAFDCDRIVGALHLRTYHTTDSFVLGQQGGTKTVKKYFVDCKIPRQLRKQIMILADDENILWILNHRTNYAYSLSDTTKQVLVVEWSRS